MNMENLLFMICVNCMIVVIGQDTELWSMLGCHDDPTYVPYEGPLEDVQFTWLGGLQYIHILNGNPHYFRLPRVVLISRLFVISTAADAANVPDGYALGNIVFGDYERDETECGLSIEDVGRGLECDPAVLLIPIADVLLHPEYKNFGMKKSLALLKLLRPVKSYYMLPVCLPLEDFVKMVANSEKTGNNSQIFYHIDYSSVVPRDFDEEEKELIILRTLPPEMCYVLQQQSSRRIFDIYHRENSSDPIREICTTNCGLRSGAPTIVQESTGHWTLVALAEGGSPCPDPLNLREATSPPAHILIYPYVSWITTAITGRSRRFLENTDPFGFQPRAKYQVGMGDRALKGWVGKWWMGGYRCYDRGQSTSDLFRFYREAFLIHPNPDWNNRVNYYFELEAPMAVNIACVKVGVPHRIGTPTAWGIDTSSVKLRIKLVNFHMPYKIEIEAWGYHVDSEHSSGTEQDASLSASKSG